MRRTLTKAIKLYIKWRHTNRAKKIVAAFKDPLHVNGASSFSGNTYLGRNTHFNGMKIHGRGKVTIGDNFHSGPGCSIRTQNHNHAGNALPYDNTYIVKDVAIGDNVWLGEGVMILPGVTIGEGAVIQARSVVVRDIPPLSIAGGHPCAVFSKRDAERYNELKNNRIFT